MFCRVSTRYPDFYKKLSYISILEIFWLRHKLCDTVLKISDYAQISFFIHSIKLSIPGEFLITFAKVHNYTFQRVEGHLPFVGPFQNTVEITLNCLSVIIIICFLVYFVQNNVTTSDKCNLL